MTSAFLYLLELGGYFLLWTGLLYWLHRAAHKWGVLWQWHQAHHAVAYAGGREFSWRNLIGFYNDWASTFDQWLLEILPTILFIAIFPRAWPLGVLYLVDNVFAEGITDHNPRICLPLLAMGRYHLAHHADSRVNFDGFTQFWDWIFATRQAVR